MAEIRGKEGAVFGSSLPFEFGPPWLRHLYSFLAHIACPPTMRPFLPFHTFKTCSFRDPNPPPFFPLLRSQLLVIDVRPVQAYRNSHIRSAISVDCSQYMGKGEHSGLRTPSLTRRDHQLTLCTPLQRSSRWKRRATLGSCAAVLINASSTTTEAASRCVSYCISKRSPSNLHLSLTLALGPCAKQKSRSPRSC